MFEIHPSPLEQTGVWNAFNRWIKEHPSQSLITQAALTGIGFATQTLSQHLDHAPSWTKTSAQVLPNILFATAFGLAAKTFWQWKHLFGQIGYGLLNVPYCANNSSPIYEPRQIKDSQGVVIAELKYENNIPILSFHESVTDPKQRGYLEGLLLGDEILDICRLGLQPMLTYLECEKGRAGKERLQKCMQELNISNEVIQEFEGMCAGVRERNRIQKTDTDLNLEWFITAAHVLGDTFKAVGTSLACSSIACKNDKGDLAIGRNFDWPSMGYIGKRLLIRQYSVPTTGDEQFRRVSSFIFPGFLGVITAWNSNGLAVIINELGRVSHGRGTPYNLIAKRLVEECSTVDQAKLLIKKIQQESPCASSISIIVADKENAALAQFYHDNDTDYFIRDLKPNSTLIVTNHFEDDAGDVIERSICEPKSVHRSNLAKQACTTHAEKDPSAMIEEALKAAGVPATIGVFISNQSNPTGQPKKIAFDNFSAHQLL